MSQPGSGFLERHSSQPDYSMRRHTALSYIRRSVHKTGRGIVPALQRAARAIALGPSAILSPLLRGYGAARMRNPLPSGRKKAP